MTTEWKCWECQTSDPKSPLKAGCVSCSFEAADRDRCDPPIVKTEEVPITLTVKIVHHHYTEHMGCHSQHPSITEAVSVWDFGRERPGFPFWDQEACHVSEDPATKQWLLLYR